MTRTEEVVAANIGIEAKTKLLTYHIPIADVVRFSVFQILNDYEDSTPPSVLEEFKREIATASMEELIEKESAALDLYFYAMTEQREMRAYGLSAISNARVIREEIKRREGGVT
jgi:hypothetical protein